MVERPRRVRGYNRRGTPHEIVAVCKRYSARLKISRPATSPSQDTPLNVKLHVNWGTIAEGTIGLETTEQGVAQLVVKAQGSNLFGLVKREHLHVFKVGELERSQSTHTAFLRRSVKLITKGNEAARDDMLARSLSLIHEREAVDITCETKEDCDMLGKWIDAKWSVAMIQKSFRKNPRIALALQGKNKTLNERGLYDTARDGGHGGQARARADGLDSVGFATLPKLDAQKTAKLQDDLLDGVYVTYHDLTLGGYRSRSSSRRLRYDCESEDGNIYLEESYQGDGETLVQKLDDLTQVGGGPSAHGPTVGLLRATQGNPAQRAAAVSLVFKTMSMDLTCGNKEDAWELVLYFSALKGFTRAAPQLRTIMDVSAHAEVEDGVEADGFHHATREPATVQSGTAVHREHPPTVVAAAAATAPVNSFDTPSLDRGPKGVDSARNLHVGPPSPTFSSRFREGIEALGKDHPTQLSASSGFGLVATKSASHDGLRDGTDLEPSVTAAPAQQRKWPTPHQSDESAGVETVAARAYGSSPLARHPPSTAASLFGQHPGREDDAEGGAVGRGKGAGAGVVSGSRSEAHFARPASGSAPPPLPPRDGLAPSAAMAAKDSSPKPGGGARRSRTDTRQGPSAEPRHSSAGERSGTRRRGGNNGGAGVSGARFPEYSRLFSSGGQGWQPETRTEDTAAGFEPERRRSKSGAASFPSSYECGRTGYEVGSVSSGQERNRRGSETESPGSGRGTVASDHDVGLHAPDAGSERRRSPPHRRRTWADGPDAGVRREQPQHLPHRTPKEVSGPVRQGVRGPAQRRGTVGDRPVAASHAIPMPPHNAASEAAARRLPHRKHLFPQVADRYSRGEELSHARPASPRSSSPTSSPSPMPPHVAVPFTSPADVALSAWEAQVASEGISPRDASADAVAQDPGVRRRFGGIERTEPVAQQQQSQGQQVTRSLSPVDSRRPPPPPPPPAPQPASEDPHSKRHAIRRKLRGLRGAGHDSDDDEDEDYTTVKVKADTSVSGRSSTPTRRRRCGGAFPHSPTREVGGRRKAIGCLLRGGGDKLKQLAAGAGHRKHHHGGGVIGESPSPSPTAEARANGRRHRHGLFFTSPRTREGGAVDTFVTNFRSEPGDARAKSPAR